MALPWLSEGQADGGDGVGRDALARPMKPRPSLVVALTPTRSTAMPADLGDAGAHGVAVRRDPGPFGDQRHVELGDHAAAGGDAGDGVGEEAVGGGAAPLRVGWREMLADVAVADGAEHGIGERMQDHVGVGMADHARAYGAPARRRA